MWHKAECVGHLVKLERTRNDLLNLRRPTFSICMPNMVGLHEYNI